MLGTHIVHTQNNRIGVSPYNMLLFEVLTMVLSCLNWKKYEGPIKLYTDQPFYDYIKDLGLLWLWDEIDLETLKTLPENVNYSTFWAYPKLYINSLQEGEFANLDIDLYIDGPIKKGDYDLLLSNIEICDNNTVYPPYHTIKKYSDKLNFKDFKDYASNVALCVVKNKSFYREYLKVVNDFVIGNDLPTIDGCYSSSLITFIEQRLLYSMAEYDNIKVEYQIDGTYDSHIEDWLGDYETNGLTHLWGWKYIYRREERYDDRINLTSELKDEIFMNFPNEWNKIHHIFGRVSL